MPEHLSEPSPPSPSKSSRRERIRYALRMGFISAFVLWSIKAVFGDWAGVRELIKMFGFFFLGLVAYFWVLWPWLRPKPIFKRTTGRGSDSSTKPNP